MRLFHTKHARVEYVNQFSEWVAYEHRVKAAIAPEEGEYEHEEAVQDRRGTSNRDTINALFPEANLKTGGDTANWLDSGDSSLRIKDGEESALTRAGRSCTRLF